MALKTKTQETLPDEFEVTEVEQVTFDDVIADMEAEHVDPDELESGGQKFYTITVPISFKSINLFCRIIWAFSFGYTYR